MSTDKKTQIKEAIRQLHAGVPPQQVKEKFRTVLEGIDSLEIAKIEDELIREGMKREDMQRLCDVHMAIFKDQIEKQSLNLKPTQPISILMEEHKIMTKMAEDLLAVADKIHNVADFRYIEEDIHQIEHLASNFTDSEKHYQREENVLFPYLEKHGISEPPSVMWMEHDKIRETKKKLLTVLQQAMDPDKEKFKQNLWETANALANLLPSHFFKENNILFPTALSVFTQQEWIDIRKQFDQIGYCCFTPPTLITAPSEAPLQPEIPTPSTLMQFENGNLTEPQLNSLLDTLPVEITFIDENDTVRYFNLPEKIIFVRTKAIIGRKVQNCHPAKSLDTVTKILDSFKSGRKNLAEFWINLSGRMIFIRFFAVRSPEGTYLGTMEVVQDVTDIQKLQGEKRLLDWTD
ncbi:MAG: DUF438 domain-containing protein [Candidatus Bathyarchaeota archaeon]|nr:DUF438 domain-containing protein [Candidatus Bathyarchaeota archaeon]